MIDNYISRIEDRVSAVRVIRLCIVFGGCTYETHNVHRKYSILSKYEAISSPYNTEWRIGAEKITIYVYEISYVIKSAEKKVPVRGTVVERGYDRKTIVI